MSNNFDFCTRIFICTVYMVDSGRNMTHDDEFFKTKLNQVFKEKDQLIFERLAKNILVNM